jgi:hypothetical protein
MNPPIRVCGRTGWNPYPCEQIPNNGAITPKVISQLTTSA